MRILGLCLALLFSASARASLFIEPYGGYAVGTMSETTVGGTGVSGSNDGFGYGGRAGFLIKHFVILGAEYQGLSTSEKLTSAGVAQTALNWNAQTIFGTFGFQAPRGFRLIGSYGFSAQADESTTPDKTHYKGTALKLAIGYHFNMPVAINLEYTIYNYTSITNNGTTSALSNTYSKYNYSTVMATMSFPFEFGHHLFGGGGGSSSGSSHNN